MGLAAAYTWDLATGDIKTAFLNGDKTEEQRFIFAEPPVEAKEMLGMKSHECFRILKAVYGLLHAPRFWYAKLDSVLQEQGWLKSRLEPCVWKLFSGDQLCGLIGGHVDDLPCVGFGNHYQEKIALARKSFPFGAWREGSQETMKFCGRETTQRSDKPIEVNQESDTPIRSTKSICARQENWKRTRRPTKTKGNNTEVLGALAWRSTQTAPWLSASASYLQGCFNEATSEDVLSLNKLVRAQKQFCSTPLLFPSNITNLTLVTFHDAPGAVARICPVKGAC